MKFRYQMTVLCLVIVSLLLVTLFTNCQGMKQGSDEYGQTIFSDYSEECTSGKLCKTENELECFDPRYYIEPEPNLVCKIAFL